MEEGDDDDDDEEDDDGALDDLLNGDWRARGYECDSSGGLGC